MKKQRIKRRGMSFLLVCVMLIASLSSTLPMLAYSTTGIGDKSTISPSNSQFESAASPKYTSESVSVSGKINTAYQMYIYHYEAPVEGYYRIYTTGSTDTVAEVYEQQNFLWVTTEYKKVARNDDGYYLNNGMNSSMVVHLDQWEDYYICVRAYGTKTGEFVLNIAPNKDEIISKAGGSWDCEKLTNSAAISQTWTAAKQYLTKEQVILLYWMYDPAIASNYSIETLRSKYNKSTSDALSYANAIIGSIAGVNPVASLSISMLGTIINEVYGEMTTTDWEMMKMLVDKCGVSYNTTTGKWSAKSGLLAKEVFSSGFTFYYYYGSNATILEGEKYYYGSWQ